MMNGTTINMTMMSPMLTMIDFMASSSHARTPGDPT